ncbi:8-amino-7-oxononanoate synthase [Cyanobacterium aponinum FACHB-4101]|uniref:8-amino-7-oxononanoate synthase n=1 Tax=Cyanobacterium aponinum TaxID=379064 RepID=UPI001680F953|nr:8-amino-7-oxononanoate synthase [Cyanobacterium aponinum]MBD2395551.1 8-amino-7-oxononanoate synthase [Cyanobacterium aponinum FACHB-4101]
MSSLNNYLSQSLNTIKKAHWYRQEKLITGLPSAVVSIEGRQLVNFASNDYLGLAGDSRLIQAGIEALKQYGTGSTGSRLLSGHRKLHQELEDAIASWKQVEKALVFSSGYSANIGTITALVKQKDLILEDEYNHSSLKNGAKLSQAKTIEYKHGNIQDLSEKLAQNRHQYRHCLIITDSVFSMDGDLCPLPELVAITEKFDCWLLIDEAHATGVMGKTGAGCLEHFGVKGDNIIQIGTLSKAIASLGGYVAGSKLLIDFLRNRCPTWIYTTALSPADTASALAAIKLIQKYPEMRTRLWQNINLFKEILTTLKIDFLPTESAIICVKEKTAKQALQWSLKLQEKGFFVPAIRPPTVPTSRLRFSIMATHEKRHFYDLQSYLGN